MEDSKLILTLKPLNERAILAFALDCNEDRYIPPAAEPPLSPSNREGTPSTAIDDGVEYPGSQIRLSFEKEPRDVQQGFVFGNDPEICDIVLGKATQFVSKRAFRITFDTQGRPVLIATSETQNMTISYNGQGGTQIRRLFTWILFEGPCIVVNVSKLKFEIFIERHSSCQAQYKQHLHAFLEKSRKPMAAIGNLNLRSKDNTAVQSGSLSPRQRRIFYNVKKLGKGGLVRCLRRLMEVKNIKKASHEHIVKFVEFTDEVRPTLVMEYLQLGSLENQHRIAPITSEETMTILNQGLRALEYLHSLPLTHRDVKPDNILLQSRDPFHIKLADFGLAKEDDLLETQCGTFIYTAPEVFGGHGYTAKVDVWSLGVVVLEYWYWLPERGKSFVPKRWHQQLAQTLDMCDPAPLVSFLSGSMLKEDPEERLSAADCLEISQTLGSPTADAGDATPRLRRRSTSSLLRTLTSRESLEEGELRQDPAQTQVWDPSYLHRIPVPTSQLLEPEREDSLEPNARPSTREASRRDLKRIYDDVDSSPPGSRRAPRKHFHPDSVTHTGKTPDRSRTPTGAPVASSKSNAP